MPPVTTNGVLHRFRFKETRDDVAAIGWDCEETKARGRIWRLHKRTRCGKSTRTCTPYKEPKKISGFILGFILILNGFSS